MDVSPEHLVEQARERFQLQDYYGAIHLLEEVVTTGRAFADAHHMLGLSYSLVGQPEQALAQLDRALALNPHYVEALVHRAIVLNELGREAEADAAFRRAAPAGCRRRSSSTRPRWRSDPCFTTCGISWGACCCRRAARSTRGSISRSSYGRAPPTWTPPRCSGWPATSPATGWRRRRYGRRAASGGRRILEWKPISRCSNGTTPPRRRPRPRPPRAMLRPPQPGGAGGRRSREAPRHRAPRAGAGVPAQRLGPRRAGRPRLRRRYLSQCPRRIRARPEGASGQRRPVRQVGSGGAARRRVRARGGGVRRPGRARPLAFRGGGGRARARGARRAHS